MKYTIKHLRAEFGTDKKCLEFMFQARYGKKPVCPQCQKKDRFYLVESRKRFDCSCGYTISPLSGTIFHKSSTPLTLWFHAMFLFASSKNGVAAKELERQLGVTYKCAWRIKRLLQTYVKDDIIEQCYRKKSVKSVLKVLLPIVTASIARQSVSSQTDMAVVSVLNVVENQNTDTAQNNAETNIDAESIQSKQDYLTYGERS